MPTKTSLLLPRKMSNLPNEDFAHKAVYHKNNFSSCIISRHVRNGLLRPQTHRSWRYTTNSHIVVGTSSLSVFGRRASPRNRRIQDFFFFFFCGYHLRPVCTWDWFCFTNDELSLIVPIVSWDSCKGQRGCGPVNINKDGEHMLI